MTPFFAERSRPRQIAVWVLRILLGGAFLFAGWMKLTSNPQMVEGFNKVGLGQWFRYFTGALEVIGTVLMVVPRSSIAGASLLLVVIAGAFVAQVTVLHEGWIHVVVFGVLLLLLIELQRRAVSGASGSGRI